MKPRILLLALLALWLAPVAARAQDQPNGADTPYILQSDSRNEVLLKRVWRTNTTGTSDVPLAPQTLALNTVGNAATFTVPGGMGTLETLITGLSASGASVGFKASAVAGGPYSTFAVQGGSPVADVTSFATDGSWTINTAGHVQIQLVVLTAGTGSLTVAGNYSASIRNSTTRVDPAPATASTDPADTTVTTTSATVLTLNGASKNALVRNTGSTAVRLGFGAPAVAAAGFYLAPGDAWSMNSTNLTTGIVTAVTASGTSTLAIHEGH